MSYGFASYDAGLFWDIFESTSAWYEDLPGRQAAAARDLEDLPAIMKAAAETEVRGILDKRLGRIAADGDYRRAILAAVGLAEATPDAIADLEAKLDASARPGRPVFDLPHALDLRTVIEVANRGVLPG